ncbi:MAG: hypothetical protein AB7O62_13865 [Pirellulales bacterium]
MIRSALGWFVRAFQAKWDSPGSSHSFWLHELLVTYLRKGDSGTLARHENTGSIILLAFPLGAVENRSDIP